MKISSQQIFARPNEYSYFLSKFYIWWILECLPQRGRNLPTLQRILPPISSNMSVNFYQLNRITAQKTVLFIITAMRLSRLMSWFMCIYFTTLLTCCRIWCMNGFVLKDYSCTKTFSGHSFLDDISGEELCIYYFYVFSQLI